MFGALLALLLLAAAAAAVARNWVLLTTARHQWLPALWKILSHGLLTVESPRLLPTPRTGRVTLRLPDELGGGPLFSASSITAASPLSLAAALRRRRPLAVRVGGAAVAITLQPGTLTPSAVAFLAWLGLVTLPSVEEAEAADQAGGGGRGGGGDGEGGPPPSPLPADGGAAAALAAAVEAAAASAGGGVALPRGLSLTPVLGRLDARLRAWGLVVTLEGGALTLPSALAGVVGARVSLFAALGGSSVRAPGEAGRLGLPSVAWAGRAGAPPPDAARGGGGGGAPLAPFAVRAEAERGALTAHGWLTTTGVTLAAPARAALDLTPPLVQGVLGRIHPLLAGAVRLLEDDSVRVTLAPVHASGRCHAPCAALDLGVDPLRLALRPTPLVLGALRMVGGARARAGPAAAPASPTARGGGGGGRGPTSPRGARGGGGAPSGGRRREDVALCGMAASGAKPAASALPHDALEAWTGPIAARVHFGRTVWVDSGRLDMLASRNFAGGAGAAHLAMWGVVSLAAPQAGDAGSRAARARARWRVAAGWGRRGGGCGGAPRPPPASPPSSSAAPAPGRLDMTLAILSDSLGLDAGEAAAAVALVGGEAAPPSTPPPPGGGGAVPLPPLPPPPPAPPTPAARVSVRGSADAPDIAWLAATRDVLAALAEARAAPAGSRLAGWLARRRSAREAGAGPPPRPAGALPWESRLQRAGASRRSAEAGAPLPATSAARLGRAQAGRLGGGGKVGGGGGGTVLRPPAKVGGGGSAKAPPPAVSWSRDTYVAPPLPAVKTGK